MRVFVTGATGFIGKAVVRELISAGHKVIGLARSDEKAAALAAAGAEVQRGSLEDLNSLRSGAGRSDAVIHTAFDHDFSKYAENCEQDRRVIGALGSAVVGSSRPLIVTSGVSIGDGTSGRPLNEDDRPASSSLIPRAASEEAAGVAAEKGVNVTVICLPQVHDTTRHGLVSYAIELAQEKGLSGYVEDGSQRWPAAHVLDVARLYRLALEQAKPAMVCHAAAEEGVPFRDIATVIGRRFGLPVASIAAEHAGTHFGWLASFAASDAPASSKKTQQQLDWQPTGPGLIDDLESMQVRPVCRASAPTLRRW